MVGSEKIINNEIYEQLGEDWYLAQDNPVALLRAENKLKAPWILERLQRHETKTILDVGCGAGFLSNFLSQKGFTVTGLDISNDSLRVAKLYDESEKVKYVSADAYHLPFPDESFDAVVCMDFLEHVEHPDLVVKEISRVLVPGGKFFFHTFNRNLLSWLIIIKFVEWFIPNTPADMHLYKYFIKPLELKKIFLSTNLVMREITGIRPVISKISINEMFNGKVSDSFQFTLTNSLLLSYIGWAKKTKRPLRPL